MSWKNKITGIVYSDEQMSAVPEADKIRAYTQIGETPIDPTAQANIVQAFNSAVQGNTKGNTSPSPVNPYFGRYIKAYEQAGVTPTLDALSFENLYKGWQDKEGGLASTLETSLYPVVAQKYNDAYRAYTKAQGGTADPSMLMNTTYNIEKQGDWRGKGADWMLNQIKDVASKANNYVSTTADVAKQSEETKANAYKFIMPTEWQTIEDIANTTLKAGTPTLNPEDVTKWEGKLEEAYKPTRDKLKTNMADYWASLFPQGGGSGRQAVTNEESLVNLETDKLNRAFGFAQNDLATQLANFTNAQNQLSGIGQFKAGSDQFKSSQDASNAWNLAQLQWQRDKQALDTANAQSAYNQQASLAQSLAQLQKPQTPDLSTTLLNSLAGGVGTAGGMTGMAKLLALLSSKDFKKNIVDNKIDSLGMIKGLDIKNFQYKGEDKQRIGVIAEDTPDLLTTDNKKALDIVNLFGVLLDAVKKLSIKLETMELKNA